MGNNRLLGALVHLSAPCPSCGSWHGRIARGVGPHAASVRCAHCHTHAAWLGKAACKWIVKVVDLFGIHSITLRGRDFPTIKLSE